MTNEQTRTLVLKDAAGDYFLVSQETLEQGRVPAEQVAELEQRIAAAQSGTGGDDVEGYWAIPVIGFVIGFVATKKGIEAANADADVAYAGHLAVVTAAQLGAKFP